MACINVNTYLWQHKEAECNARTIGLLYEVQDCNIKITLTPNQIRLYFLLCVVESIGVKWGSYLILTCQDVIIYYSQFASVHRFILFIYF